MKVLYFISWYSVFLKRMVTQMKKRYPELEYSVFTTGEGKDGIEKAGMTSEFEQIYAYRSKVELVKLIQNLPHYDVIQFKAIDFQWTAFAGTLRRKCDVFIVSVGGSDIYRTGNFIHFMQKRLLKRADWITAESPQVLNDLWKIMKNTYPEVSHSINRFGIPVLETINEEPVTDKKRELKRRHIDENRIIITCGHNAKEQHQHLEMIDAINRLSVDIRKKLHLVLPLTYPEGKENYIRKIREKMENQGYEYTLITEFMDEHESAIWAQIADIMIHVQTTDSLSSSMLEYMYGGSIVVAGKWLPYENLKERGIFFLTVNEVADLTACLKDCLDNIQVMKDKCRANRKLIWEMSSWDAVSKEWYKLYTS